MSKTNAIRMLESAKINFTLSHYEVDENDLSALTVAEKIGVEIESVFKTLVGRGDKSGIVVFCITGNSELNLKKGATASGNKSIEMIKMKELLPISGYIRGGCSPIGMKKLFTTYIDETAKLFDQIFISAGVRGTQIRICPNELADLINAEFADLI
ncbi:MAG: Cys-tRNA(Pro) deacylase [Ignavibacteria bacterium]|nr:Cys-tRNA(Pro) deacylase [Ignavibacteria bacterium]